MGDLSPPVDRHQQAEIERSSTDDCCEESGAPDSTKVLSANSKASSLSNGTRQGDREAIKLPTIDKSPNSFLNVISPLCRKMSLLNLGRTQADA